MNISEITLKQILDARDRRANEQRRLISEYGLPLICFTMNIAGDRKNSPLIQFAFDHGVYLLDREGLNVAERIICSEPEGCTAYYVIDGACAQEIKKRTVRIEDSFPAARLYDMDVLDSTGKKVTRGKERECIICGGSVSVCSRSRAHGLAAIEYKTHQLLAELAADCLAQYACLALDMEVMATPKPGLVDSANSGAHDDMDIQTFKKSAEALRPYFVRFAKKGMELADVDPKELMRELRVIGVEAELTMNKATGNVNTHKGMIFSLGLILADTGRRLLGKESAISVIAGVDMEEELLRAKLMPQTNGERQYSEFGVKGIRGEAINSFPCARMAAKKLCGYRKRFNANDAAILTLLDIMRTLDDTNVLHRGGWDSLMLMKRESERIALLPEKDRIAAAKALDEVFIKQNISPGGCADTLALAIFLDLLCQKHYHLFNYNI